MKQMSVSGPLQVGVPNLYPLALLPRHVEGFGIHERPGNASFAARAAGVTFESDFRKPSVTGGRYTAAVTRSGAIRVDDPQDDLTLDELAGLRLILVQGRSPGPWLAKHLIGRGLVAERQDRLALTGEGRSALVRGSPASWTLVA